MANKGAWVTSGYRPGDILIMDFDGKGIDHAGICIGINPGGVLVTVEGNTGVENDANGGAVMVRLRPLSVIVGACRPDYGNAGEINRVITTALDEVGVTESPAGSNKVKYNTEYDGRAEAWCVKFIWWVYRQAGLSPLFYGGGKTASSTTLARYYGYGQAAVVTTPATVLRTGSKGADVKYLQSKLNAFGYSCGNVDGDFGQKTDKAVRRFQEMNGLTVDGIVGAKTWTALDALRECRIYCDFMAGVMAEMLPSDIKRIEYVHGLEPVESILSAYNRIGCDIIINANFFGLSGGQPTGYLADEGQVLSAGLLSKWGYEFPDKRRAVFAHWDSRTPGADFLGGYPCLVRGGIVAIDTTEAGFSAASTAATYKRGRTAIGTKADGTLVIRCVADNDSQNKITVPALAQHMISLGCVDAVNLDGGGSSSWITPWGRYVTPRKLDGFLCVWL